MLVPRTGRRILLLWHEGMVAAHVERSSLCAHEESQRSGGGLYKICIDCDPNDRVFTDVDAYNATDDGHNPPVRLHAAIEEKPANHLQTVLYSREWDTPTTHEVILQNTEDDRYGNATQITVDRFVLTILDGTPSPVRTPITRLNTLR